MDKHPSSKVNSKQRRDLVKPDSDTSRLLKEFFERHEKLFKEIRTIENCVVQAKIFSVWPPYGLAIPLDKNLYEVGAILFHYSRIIEVPDAVNASKKINIRSRYISKKGVYHSSNRWPANFQVGNDILARISLPLKDCSSRWKRLYAQDHHPKSPFKLCNLIQYKAVKVWHLPDENEIESFRNKEPALSKKNAKFDQMSNLYIQLRWNRIFCLEQFFSIKTRLFLDEFVNDNMSDAEKRKSFVSKSLQCDQIKTSTDFQNNLKMFYPCNKFNCKIKSRRCACNYNNKIFHELEPIVDNDDVYEGNDGILNIFC